MKRIFKRKSVKILVFLIFIVGLIAIYRLVRNYFKPCIIYAYPSYAVNMSNDAVLAGFADNIFIGKVEEKIGTIKSDYFPKTQFKVQVLENIKGELDGSITVSQLGGFIGYQLHLFDKDRLLEVGQYYLFVTKHNDKNDWHHVQPYYGDIFIDNEETEKELIERFTKAYKSQIIWD